MKLTNENLHALATNNNGFKHAQLRLLGVSIPPKKGWLRGLIGKEISALSYQQAMLLKTKPQLVDDDVLKTIGWKE